MLEELSKAIYFMEDFSLFKDVQIKKYLTERKTKIKNNTPEWDMIEDLIKDYWCEVLASGCINNKGLKEKKVIFKSIEIIFPYSHIPESWSDGITYVDFVSFSS